MKRVFLPGVLLNLASLVAALVGLLPYALGIGIFALGALLGDAPAMLLFVVVALAVIFLGPVFGLAFAIANRQRALSIVAAALSFASMAWAAHAAQAWGLEGLGVCKPLTNDVSELGRECSQSKTDDCPIHYSCVQRVVNIDSSWECAIMCKYDCECPTGLQCLGSKCR